MANFNAFIVTVTILVTFCLENSLADANSVNLGTLKGNVFGSLVPPHNESKNSIDVNWIIQVPTGLNIYLQIIIADMTQGDDVYIYDGNQIAPNTLAASLNGIACPFSLISSGTSLTVRYVGMSSRSPFYATYSVPITSMTTVKCSGDWQNLTSPGYPNNYGQNLDVIWTLYAPLYYNIEIRWQTFLTEQNKDFLTIFDGGNTFVKPYIEYSGNLTSSTITWMFSSTLNYLTLRFTSDDMTSDSGFLIHYVCYPSGYGPTTPMPTTPPPVTVPPPSDVCSFHGNYTCNCFYGYTGQHCENEVNFCEQLITDYKGAAIEAGSLCVHGSCVSSPMGASCNCSRGFTGQFCENEVQNETFIASRCALYPTNYTTTNNVPVGCPASNICIPDNLNCAIYESCQQPLGWCIPKSGASSHSYISEVKSLMQNYGKLVHVK